MDKQFGLTFNGQQVQKDDLDMLGDVAGLADDRTLATILRMGVGSALPLKGVMTIDTGANQTSTPNAIVTPGGAGKVQVTPSKYFVGSRSNATVDGQKFLRDLRSAWNISAGVAGVFNAISLTANSSGFARIDLIYAAVAIDVNSSSVLRKVKDPSSKVVTEQSVAVSKVTTVAFSKVDGTPSASPVAPVLPTDSAGTYYIPLAYVRVPNGFSASSTVLGPDIVEIAPLVDLQPGLGATRLHVAKINRTMTAAQLTAWANSGTRPEIYIPQSIQGTESLIVAIDTATMADGAVLDDSAFRWGDRLTRWQACFSPSSEPFAWTNLSMGGTYGAPNSFHHGQDAQDAYFGMGQTIALDENGSTNRKFAAVVKGGTYGGSFAAPEYLGVYFDVSDGLLKLAKTAGVGNLYAVFWIEFTQPFRNIF